LASRLAPWVGEHGWLFDNAEDGLDLGQATLGFDMTRVLDAPALRTPLMMYLFHRVDERLDGSPTIIVIDEGWKALDDEVFVARIRDWEKTIRKRGGILGFVTQNAEDALASRIAGAIVEQSATQIFTANPKARAQDYIEGFGLTRHEFELVRSLPESAHGFLVKHGGESVVVRLNLSGEAELLSVLSGREASIRRFDAIRAEVGDDPAAWMPRLMEGV
jgi:type IV secretion system protein VirB4